MQRRWVLKIVGTGLLGGIAGCSGNGSDDIEDSDGDGVVDSEDYAPNDPDVQEKSDLTDGSPTPTPTVEPTPSPEPTGTLTSSPESAPSCKSASYEELEDSLEIVDVRMDLDCLAGNVQVERYTVTFENTGQMNGGNVNYRVQYLDEGGTVIAENEMVGEEYPAPGRQAVAEDQNLLNWSCGMIEDVYDAIGAGRVDFVITEKYCNQ